MKRKPRPSRHRAKAAKRNVAAKASGVPSRNLETRLAEALEQQAATAEILRIIASSPTDVLPTYQAIASAATRLCGARDTGVIRFDGTLMHMMANSGLTSEERDALRAQFPRPADRTLATGRAILSRAVAHVADITKDPDYDAPPLLFMRAVLSVPMLRDGQPIGAITVTRREAKPFSASQIALLETFARQAVIAIENVRLFTELEARNRDLTATSEILRVISRSPTDAQPVFDAIVESAVHVCDGIQGNVYTFDGELLHHAAEYNARPASEEYTRAAFPRPPGRDHAVGRAVLDRAVVHIPDAEADRELSPATVRARGGRSVVAIPLLRDGSPVGVISVGRPERQPFSAEQIALLQTFADQAVIAIENVRLFTELQTSNRELTTALDKQTATSDILAVISRSQTDIQPVFDAIVTSAVRLLGGYAGTLTRAAGNHLELVAITSTDPAGDAALRARFPQSLRTDNPHTRTVRARTPLNIADAQAEPSLSDAMHAYAGVRGFRSQVVVPLLRHDEAVGTIAVTRREPGGFTNDEITLLKTFADQAVIAIENARLLTELQARTQELTRSVGELTALGEVGRALSSTLDLERVLQTIVLRANELAGTAGCTIWEYDATREEFRLRASDYVDEEEAAALGTVAPVTTIRRGQGVTGQVMETRQPVQIHDIAIEGAEENPIRQRLIAAGHHALLAVPLLREDEVLGVLVVTRKAPGQFQPEVVQLLSTFGTQSALAIQNARLFREIEIKSRELEVASQHKSEFLAGMSHELRTPLNAIIGFSDVLLQGMFGEMTDKQTEYLRDILASGQHLLSLINDILDLSKIEAGRMELDLADFHLPSAIDDALLLMRERAGRRGLALERHVDERLGEIRADQRKVKQVLLNLLSNAVKFTPEGGRIDVRAALVDGTVEISVTDTGVGIAPEDHDAVFEEFRQVGKSDKKAEGTGLGLALCRKFVELHGGRIWVKSAIRQGSTFTFTISA